jgi:hypothetical protein
LRGTGPRRACEAALAQQPAVVPVLERVRGVDARQVDEARELDEPRVGEAREHDEPQVGEAWPRGGAPRAGGVQPGAAVGGGVRGANSRRGNFGLRGVLGRSSV